MNPVIRTSGHAYNTGLVPGAVLGIRTGITEDPEAPDVRIWRIRKDYATADLTDDAADLGEVSPEDITSDDLQALRDQYELDWLEWPAHKGAPFYDADGDGLYEPVIVDGNPVLFPDADEPGLAKADQVIWYVANDVADLSPWGGTRTGLEVQQTIWAYNRSDQLSESVFKRYRIIYKGLAETSEDAFIDSMYLGQFSDPDLGGYADDFAGCDSILSLGYCYNASATDYAYAAFGLPPPAIGYIMLQGPLVMGNAGQDRNRNGVDDVVDVAIFDLRYTPPGQINLLLTSFVYAACGGLECWPLDAPLSYAGALQMNCVLQGLPGTPQPPPCPAPNTDPTTGKPAPRFWLYGDPVTGTGWIDGWIEGPGDRRIVLATGPFTMAIGDTQEIIVGVVGGLGVDRLNSITRLKLNARYAQVVYQNLFVPPGPAAQPHVRAVGFDRQVLLDWEFDPESISTTEDSTIAGGYLFEGYKVYQVSDESGNLQTAKLLAQFDLVNGVKNIQQLMPDPVTGELLPVNVQYGTDNGIRRTLAVSADSLRGGSRLVNGRTYYFAVTAYSYTPDASLQVRTYESNPMVVAVQPETPKPGTRYPYAIGDTVVTVQQVAGHSHAQILPLIYNPEKQEGYTYQVSIDTTSSGSLTWSLSNSTTGALLYSNVEQFSAEVSYRVQESGFDLFVAAPPTGVLSVTDQDSNHVFGALILSADGTLEGLRGTSPETGEDYEIRFGEESFALSAGDLSFLSKVIRVPFSVYDVGRGAGDPSLRQVMTAVRDSGSTLDSWNPTPIGLLVGDSLYRVFEPIYASNRSYIPDDPGTVAREDSFAISLLRSELFSMVLPYFEPSERSFYAVFVVTDSSGLAPTSGSIRISKYHEMRVADEFEIALGSVVRGDVELAKGDVAAIKAFPNPYYGMNVDETSLTGRFITFNHLPARAVVRIYNLAGIHVRQLVKNDPTTQYLRWDLRNEHNNLVGSGIYIVHLELDDDQGNDLGEKTLKLVIIQGEQ
jgi:hypothetical protein